MSKHANTVTSAGLPDPAPPTRVGPPVSFRRTTRDGRRLHYELKVLQQPERARACGSGPKCEPANLFLMASVNPGTDHPPQPLLIADLLIRHLLCK